MNLQRSVAASAVRAAAPVAGTAAVAGSALAVVTADTDFLVTVSGKSAKMTTYMYHCVW